MFWKKDKGYDEYKVFYNRLSELESRFNTFESRLKAQEIENETMRNKVLRKIQFRREEIEEEEKQTSPFPKSKNINTFSPFG